MQGCFEVIKKENYDVECRKIDKYCQNGIPDEQRKLYTDIEYTSSIIKNLKIPDKNIKLEYFNKLFSLAQVGLTGPTAQPDLAEDALESLKRDILMSQSGRIKNRYMILLGVYALILILVSEGIIQFIFSKKGMYIECQYLNALIGAMLGAWVSFGVRKIELNIEELSCIEKDMLNPAIRLIFVGLCSMIFMLFIHSGLFKFSIGDISIESIKESWELQILVGVIAGLMEYKLAIGIYNKANDIVSL